MNERIMVPVDGSPFAESVIPYARGIADRTGAKVTLVRVAYDDDAEAALLYVKAVAGRVGAEGEVIESERLGVGHDLLQYAERQRVDVLAMTTHGRGGILETFLGSAATHVVREATRPVLLYRPREEIALDEVREISSIIVPLDGSDFSERVLPGVVGLAEATGATVTLVQVVEPAGGQGGDVGPIPARGLMRHHATDESGPPPGDVLETSYVQSVASRIAREHGLSPEWEVLRGRPGKAVSDYASEAGTGALLVMSSHGRTGVQKTVMGSVSSECVRRSGVPVLVYGPAVPE